MQQDTVSCEHDRPCASSLPLFYRPNYFQYLTQGMQKQDRDCFKMCSVADAVANHNPSAPSLLHHVRLPVALQHKPCRHWGQITVVLTANHMPGGHNENNTQI